MLTLNRSSFWAVVVVLLLVPLPTPVGSFFLAEPAVFGAFVVLFMRRGRSMRVPSVVIIGPILVVWMAIDALGGHDGGLGIVQHESRAVLVIAAGVVVIANARVPRELGLDILVKVGTILGVLAVLERIIGFNWEAASIFAEVAKTYRVAGPLGPGHTCTILLAASYVSVVQRRYPHLAVQLVGLLLLASRAHLVGLAVIVIALALGQRLKLKQMVAGAFAVAVAAILVPSGVVRLLAAGAEQERQRSRLILWNEVFRVTDWGTLWGGLGPGNFSFRINSTAVATFAHSQFLTPWVDFGLVGLLCLVIVIVALARRSRATGTWPLYLGWVATSVFGEFIFGPTVPGAIGSLSCWYVVFVGVPARTGPTRRRTRFVVSRGGPRGPSGELARAGLLR